MPRRRRAGGRRPRTTQQREGEAPRPPEARPTLSVAAPEEAAERASRRVSPSTGTAAKTASRHISRDYSYVTGELKRIAITVGFIIAGLIGVAVALR